MAAFSLLHDGQHLLLRQGLPVNPVSAERIKDIRQGDKLGRKRYGIAGQAIGISGAVLFFMMIESYIPGHVKQRDIRFSRMPAPIRGCFLIIANSSAVSLPGLRRM